MPTTYALPSTIHGLMQTGKLHFAAYAVTRPTFGLAPGAQVDVFDHGTYQRRTLTMGLPSVHPVANPLVTDANAAASVYVVPRPIDVRFALAGITPSYMIQDALPLDPRLDPLISQFTTIQANLSQAVTQGIHSIQGTGRLPEGYALGGSLSELQQTPLGTFVVAVNAIRLQLSSAAFPTSGLTLVATCETDGSGGSITPQLTDVTHNAIAGTGIPVTPTLPTQPILQRVPVTLSPGLATYVLEFTLSTPTMWGSCTGYLEVAG